MTSSEVETRTTAMAADHGSVCLSFPVDLSDEDLSDIEVWFEITLRTMRRIAESRRAVSASTTGDSRG